MTCHVYLDSEVYTAKLAAARTPFVGATAMLMLLHAAAKDFVHVGHFTAEWRSAAALSILSVRCLSPVEFFHFGTCLKKIPAVKQVV